MPVQQVLTFAVSTFDYLYILTWWPKELQKLRYDAITASRGIAANIKRKPTLGDFPWYTSNQRSCNAWICVQTPKKQSTFGYSSFWFSLCGFTVCDPFLVDFIHGNGKSTIYTVYIYLLSQGPSFFRVFKNHRVIIKKPGFLKTGSHTMMK
jgi:hypothetical protein